MTKPEVFDDRVTNKGIVVPVREVKVLSQKPDIEKIEQGTAKGVYLEVVPFERTFLTEQMVIESEGELDPQKINYLAKSIKREESQVPRILMKARATDGQNGLPGFQYEILHKPGLAKALESLGRTDCQAIVLYGWDDFDLKNAQPADLIKLSELGTEIDVETFVSVDRLILEGMINDEQKENRLFKQMGDRGQEIRIWVRPGLDHNEVVYDVVDGFHRSSSLRKLGIKIASARVTYGMSDEELYDQRIAAATTQSVKFARVIRDMFKSYRESVWAKKYKLKLSSVIGLAAQKSKVVEPGKILGLTPDEARLAIAWGENKAVVWREDISTIYSQIRAAEDSFEEIIEQVRSSTGGGHKGSGLFNAVRFFALADELPCDLYLQRKMLKVIKEHDLNSDEIHLVARVLKLKRHVPFIIKALEFDPVNVAKEILGGEEMVSKPTSENGSKKKRFNMMHTYGSETEETGSRINPSGLTDVDSRRVSARLSENGQTLNWLEQVPNISVEEKTAVIRLFLEGKLPEEVCQELKVTPNKLEQLVFSAQRKYALHTDDIRFAQQFIKPR